MNAHRRKAFKQHGRCCDICGAWGEAENRIEVHHRDCDRKNNDVSNLQVLCSWCHQRTHNELRWGHRFGRYDYPDSPETAAARSDLREAEQHLGILRERVYELSRRDLVAWSAAQRTAFENDPYRRCRRF